MSWCVCFYLCVRWAPHCEGLRDLGITGYDMFMHICVLVCVGGGNLMCAYMPDIG